MAYHLETFRVHKWYAYHSLNIPALMELIFNPCGEFRWSPGGSLSQNHSPHLHVGAPGIFSDLLRSVQMLRRQWGAKSNGKLYHLFIPSKSATLVPEFAVEDLPLGRTVALVYEFTVKDLPLTRTFWWRWWWLIWRIDYMKATLRWHAHVIRSAGGTSATNTTPGLTLPVFLLWLALDRKMVISHSRNILP